MTGKQFALMAKLLLEYHAVEHEHGFITDKTFPSGRRECPKHVLFMQILPPNDYYCQLARRMSSLALTFPQLTCENKAFGSQAPTRAFSRGDGGSTHSEGVKGEPLAALKPESSG
jgi:hypothetical protein